MKIYNPTVSYTSVSVNLLQQLNARGGYPAGTDAPKSQSLPGLKFAPSAAASAIMRILMGSEGVTASANSTGNSLRMEIERYTHGENDHITQVRAAGSGDVDLAVVSSRKESISVVTAGGNDIIQVVGNRVSGVSGERGNDHIQIVGLASKKLDDHTVGFVSGDDGNDTIAIASRGEVDVVEGGDGNDAIAITAQGDVDRVSGGDGNDAIAISTAGYVLRLEGGDGNDAIAIAAGRDVNLIDGGDGRDTIAVSAKGSVSMLDGGDGDDVISISADDTSLIDGGDGNDTISVTAKWQAFASGGDGNDVLSLSGREVRAGGGDGNDTLQLSGHDLMAVGGTGNDRIKLDSTSGQVATLRMAEGDGNDVVESNTSLNIARYSSDGTARLDPANATLAHNDDGTVTVSFEGSSDSVTVKFTGAMAGHEIGMRIENGNLVVGPANGQS
ncbi:calcium-binding protein [Aminobacter aminovorans]|uniref:calcium-binding protein n=1 Tax=Aminobacter TaxID=31988 RepID=UPI002854EA1A|nr:calcium-binding protein [Aminobacter aminovorans]MDR7220972.1 Ca2+-binding RTX toxin-like protein [Aminobacter aminovorans]